MEEKMVYFLEKGQNFKKIEGQKDVSFVPQKKERVSKVKTPENFLREIVLAKANR